MTGNIEIANTTEARNHCATLDTGVVYYNGLISDLQNAKTKIQANWEGDAAAISDVITRIDNVVGTLSTNVTAMDDLSKSIVEFADEIDKVSDTGLGEGGKPISGSGNGSAPTTSPGKENVNTEVENLTKPHQEVKEKVGFWEYHGNNFADAWTSQDWKGAWDYSNCDGLLSGIGTTVDGVLDTAGNIVDAAVDTVGAAFNFVVDGAVNLVGWLFD